MEGKEEGREDGWGMDDSRFIQKHAFSYGYQI